MKRLVVIGAACVACVPSATADSPTTREELTAASHGDRDWALLDSYDWCPEGEKFCMSGTIDYAAPDRVDRLPIHPGGVIRLRTGEPAQGVSVSFEGVRREAKRRDDSDRRWRVRVPRSATGRMWLGLVVDYRYGKYRFSLPVRQHRHD